MLVIHVRKVGEERRTNKRQRFQHALDGRYQTNIPNKLRRKQDAKDDTVEVRYWSEDHAAVVVVAGPVPVPEHAVDEKTPD